MQVLAIGAPFEKGEVVVWCDEFLVVRRAWKTSGEVTYLDGSLFCNNFRWTFEGESTRLATEAELADIERRWPHLVAAGRSRLH